METVKVGMREFRENLAGYLESGTPLAIMRHGETLGFYIPAQKRNQKAELQAMRAAAKELDEMIASWGASEDQLMEEYKDIRRIAREKKKNAREGACSRCEYSGAGGLGKAGSRPGRRTYWKGRFLLATGCVDGS